MTVRNVTPPDPRTRFGLYRLCECPECGGHGKVPDDAWPGGAGKVRKACPECRGEGRIRQCVAEAETPEAVGVALVTCAREGEWEGCAFGCLDRMPECANCMGTGETAHDGGFYLPDCPECDGSGVKPTGTWLILPWPSTARTVRAAAQELARSKRSS